MLTQKISLRVHTMARHTGEGLAECDLCGGKDIEIDDVGSHMKGNHGEMCDNVRLMESQAVDPDPKLPCSECDKMLTQKISLRVHMMARHTGEKPFKYNSCEKRFVTSSRMKKHFRRVHEGGPVQVANIPQLPCSECDKMLKGKQALRTHIMAIHSGERPFKCDVGEKGFVTARKMKKHKRIHKDITVSAGTGSDLDKTMAVTFNEAETSESAVTWDNDDKADKKNVAVTWDNDDKADKKNATFVDSEESTDSSTDEEESDHDECLATNLDKSENRFRGFARLLAAALRQHSERV